MVKKLFGFDPENKINKHLDNLQIFVNSILKNNKINVRDYYSSAKLMERIMFEYGC